MKVKLIRGTVIGAILAVMCAFNLHAAPANIAGLLKDAYADLDHADHDYKGHRAKAMRQVEEAGKLLHLNLRGDGRGREKQGVSDEQLRAAEGVLNQIKGELGAEKHNKVLRHVNDALGQLHTALKIK